MSAKRRRAREGVALERRPRNRRELRLLRLPRIRTLGSLCDLVAGMDEVGVPLYVRHSSGIVHDIRLGCSWDELLHRREPGLSVVNLSGGGRPAGEPYVVARAVLDYLHVLPEAAHPNRVPDIVSYVLTGTEVGRGGDGEPLLDAATWLPVALLDIERFSDECSDVMSAGVEAAHAQLYAGAPRPCVMEYLYGPWRWPKLNEEYCGAPCLERAPLPGCMLAGDHRST